MAEVITTLHPENDESIDLYPNIKKENIPANAIETDKIANEAVTENKLDPELQARLADEVVIIVSFATTFLCKSRRSFILACTSVACTISTLVHCI